MTDIAPTRSPAWPVVHALLWTMLAVSVLSAAVGFGWLAALRVPYPFELEWMEGAMADHVGRVLDGEPLYVAPSVDHVAYLYTPLYYYLSAALALLTGFGFLPLRLISVLATLGCVALLVLLVRRETRSWPAAAVAAGVFLGGYGITDSWYDLARNDTLFLALASIGVYLLRWTGRRGAVIAGLCFCLAFLAKQTALMVLPAVVLGVAVLDWRKAIWFGVAAVVSTAAAVLTYHLATDGWFGFFVFEMPRGHGIVASRRITFWTKDMLPLLPLLVLGFGYLVLIWRSPVWRVGLFHVACAGGLLLSVYVSRLHAGGYVNVLMYGLLGCALLLGLLLGRLPRGWMLGAVQALCLLQFVLLAYEPWRFVPDPRHRAASEELVDSLRAVDGDALLLFHGYVLSAAGKPSCAHAMALNDVLHSGRHPDVAEVLRASIGTVLESGRYKALVVNASHASYLAELFGEYLKRYALRATSIIDDPTALRPLVGMATFPSAVLEPVDEKR